MQIVSVAAAFSILALFSYGAYRLGLDGGLARGTYVQTIALREEAKCLAAGDMPCIRANWELRAAIAAGGARRGVAAPLPTGVGDELSEYLKWYGQQQAPRLKER